MLLLISCLEPVDSGGPYVDGSQALDTSGFTTWPEGDTAVTVDADGDGFTSEDDCDDGDPEVHPGAEERWNELDDDCDSIVDADGVFGGTLSVSIAAEKEGTVYTWSGMSCPATLTRQAGELDFAVTCTPSSSGSRKDVQGDLVGTEILLSPYPGDEQVSGSTWSGWLSMESEAFDTEGEAAASWSGFDELTLEVSDAAFSLSMSGSGSLTRE